MSHELEASELQKSLNKLDLGSDDTNISKKGLKKLLAAQEKEKKKAEIAARLEAEKATRETEDFSKDKYGILPLMQSSDRPGKVYSKIASLSENNAGVKILLRARVHTIRAKGKQVFLVLRQRFDTIQAFVSPNETTVSKGMVKFISNITKESIVDISGTISKASVISCSQHGIELIAESCFVVSAAPERLPFPIGDAKVDSAVEDGNNSNKESSEADLAKVNLDTRLNYRYFELRTIANQAIFGLQSGICTLFREFLLGMGFIEIHSPKMISAASEGGANVFPITYFKGSAYLAQSPQLYKQMAVVADFPGVFEITPVFRAENSNTHRHLTEFTGCDMEMPFMEHYHEVVEVLGRLFNHIFKGISERFSKEIEIIRQHYPFEDFVYPEQPLILTFAEGVALLRAAGIEASEMEDLSTEQERTLGKLVKEKYNTDFYILDKFPLDARAFYTMPDPNNPKLGNAYDFFVRGEEILSGAQRIHDIDLLTKRANERGVDIKTIHDYVESFRYGAPPHAGGGIGLERVVMLYCNLGNIRNASLFPRDPSRLTP